MSKQPHPIVSLPDSDLNLLLVHPRTISRLLSDLESPSASSNFENNSSSQDEDGQWDKDNCGDRWE